MDLDDYPGQWVAVTSSRVLVAADTAEAAYKLALESDPDEAFVLRFVLGEEKAVLLSLPPLLEQIQPLLEQTQLPVYLVGGALRDALLQRGSHDLDLLVPQDALPLTFSLAGSLQAPGYVLDKERQTGRIVLRSEKTTLDVAQYRGSDLLADLSDRDFTINSMALPAVSAAKQEIIDPSGGLEDLAQRRLRLTRADALERDPVRVLRAVRLQAELEFSLTPDTVQKVRSAAASLTETAPERARDEVLRIVQSRRADQALAVMVDLDLIPHVLPEIASLAGVVQSPPHYEDVLAHTISVLRWLTIVEDALLSPDRNPSSAPAELRPLADRYGAALREHLQREVDGGIDARTILRMAALFHDAGKKQTQTVDEDGRIRFFGHDDLGAKIAARRLRALCLSNAATTQVATIVQNHMRPLMLRQAQTGDLSRRAAYRFFNSAGENGLDVCLLSLADHLAAYGGTGDGAEWSSLVQLADNLLQFYFERYEETIKPLPLVNGRDLMKTLNLSAGPEIGRLLRLIEENQAAGEILTREDALRFAARQVS